MAGGAITGAWILSGVLAMIVAAPIAYLCIMFLRFLSVKVGFSGFAYYSWGAAMFTLILYLTI
jgi:undecaprenyl pyrophosphate phosphatase UppP